tara:strand:+ start:450 stop:662 length:213 start_codon:yes stop_codon:yes gene_type:complete
LSTIFFLYLQFGAKLPLGSYLTRWVFGGGSQIFGAVDLLIAAVALRNDAIVWILDKDFYQMERFGFVELA